MGGVREIAFSPEVRSLAKKVLVDRSGRHACRDGGGNARRRSSSAFSGRWASTRRSPIASRTPPAPELVEFQIDPTLVVFDKAVARLGYAGVVPRDEALGLTRDWATAARLL